jgi:hypothetical protein
MLFWLMWPNCPAVMSCREPALAEGGVGRQPYDFVSAAGTVRVAQDLIS